MTIEAIFEAEAVSVSNLFTTEGGNVGFKIPIYQRPYDWTTDNIQRLFEDMLSGLEWRAKNPDSLTFLGTVITLSGEKKERSFNGQSLSIIDGQQRLTTIALLACILHDEIRLATTELATQNITRSLVNWLTLESENTLLKLLFIIRGNLITGGGTGVFPFPRIIREDFDNRANDFSSSQYDSVISAILFRFVHEYIKINKSTLQKFPQWFDFPNSDESTSVQRNLLTIQRFVLGVKESNEEKFPEDFASKFIAVNDLNRRGLRHLMTKLPLDQSETNALIELCIKHEEVTSELIRLICFANYLLEGVVVTLVKVKDEKYGFDIFESLNSTGEPLTAIQTFKPAVIKFEQSVSKYSGSESKQYFDEIESYTDSFTKTTTKQRVSKEIVVSFALYVTGEKIGGSLDAQRRYLRNNFAQVGTDKKTYFQKRLFVKSLSEVTKYREFFWTNNDLESIPRLGPRKRKVLLCLAFLRDSNHSLTIPILCRYFYVSKQENDPSLFSDAVFALTAFVVLRRAVTGNTANIDSDFRGLMSHGFDTKQSAEKLPVCKGEMGQNTIPSIDELKAMLKQRLSKNRINIVEKSDWVERVSRTELYGKSTALCKFLILAASHNAREIDESGKGYLLKKERQSGEVDFLNYSTWREDQTATVEHIAPDQPGANWADEIYNAIYQIPYLKNTIGNLTLLPAKENTSLGNRSWSDKRLLFRAFSAKRMKDVEDIISEAGKKGFNFHKTTQKLLKERAQLPLSQSLTNVSEWTKEVIESRSKNIADLVWDEIAEWIGI